MFFLSSLAFWMIQWILAIWPLVPLPFLKQTWTSGNSRFTYCWSLAWRSLNLFPLLSSVNWILAAELGLHLDSAFRSRVSRSPPGIKGLAHTPTHIFLESMERQEDLRSSFQNTWPFLVPDCPRTEQTLRLLQRCTWSLIFSVTVWSSIFFPVANAGVTPQAVAALAPRQFHLWLPWWLRRIFSTSHITLLSSELWVLPTFDRLWGFQVMSTVHPSEHFTMWLMPLSFEKPRLQLKTFWPALKDVRALWLAYGAPSG